MKKNNRFFVYISKVLVFIIIMGSALISFPTMSYAGNFDFDQYITPFWETTTMYNESVMMVSTDGGLPEASLLFTPIQILSVKSNDLNTTYVEGVDWVYQNGKLKLLNGSSASYMTHDELYPTVPGDTMPKVGGGYVYFAEGRISYRQLVVTYTHASNVWNGPITQYQGSNLSGTVNKLINGLPLKVVLYGDSIAAGASASGNLNIAPYMPSWGQLFVSNLELYYNSSITYVNAAVPGTTSYWGKDCVHSLVTNQNPDLVIIAFGMNDGTNGVSPQNFKSNIQTMINDVKAQNPNAEFVLVATTLANPESYFAGEQVNYKAVLQELTGTGTVMLDMTGVHQELLSHKAFIDMTGNNINHPNDFLIRWYAQQLSRTLIQVGQLKQTNNPGEKVIIVDDSTQGTGTTQNAFNFVGSSWNHYTNATGYYQNSVALGYIAGDYVTIPFTGTQINLYTLKQPDEGIAAISIDGGTEQIVDLYSANSWHGITYTSGLLTNGPHTLKVRVTGNKNANSTQPWIQVDRVDISTSPVTIVDDTVTGSGNNQMNFVGSSWQHYTVPSSDYYNNSISLGYIAGDYMSTTFNGTQVSVYTFQQPDEGIMDIYIDNVKVATVDNYSSFSGDELRWTSGALSSGQHTLKIVVTGNKNVNSSQPYIQVDRIDIQ